ncbi:hypothetical protein ACO1O0_002562 [Amphichorda felina]
MRTPKPAKRSACDRCRAKRVRCPRAPDSVEPCARCVSLAVPCITASAGYPGRPRKTPRLTDRSAAAVASPGFWTTPGDGIQIGLETRGVEAVEESMSADVPFDFGDASMSVLGNLGVTGFSARPAAYPSRREAVFPDHSDPWPVHGGEAPTFFDLPLSGERSPVAGGGLDFLSSPRCEPNPAPPAQRPSAASSLVLFGEKMERRVSVIDPFLANPRNIIDDCQEDSLGLDTENPVAVLLALTTEFISIIGDLTASANTSAPPFLPDQLLSPSPPPVDSYTSLSTEKILLVLSNYIQLMRLYDGLFHDVYRSLSQVPPEKIQSIKVKAVLRIGGISSLQDMTGKAYAQGIVEVIQSHIYTLERCMGLPMVYCLSSKEEDVPPQGIFADAGRALLLHTAMAQEDVISRRGNKGPQKSFVESIRENIKNTVALF